MIPMSDAGPRQSRRESGSTAEPYTLRLDKLHTGDTVRVVGSEQVLDPAAVIAVWPYCQADFSGTDHPEIQLKDHHTLSNHRYDSDDDVRLWKLTGTRATFATKSGNQYAAVDWNTDDPTVHLYLLVIDSAEPDSRRWDRVGELETVERYGEPEDRPPEWVNRLPSEDIPPWVVEQDAEPDFNTRP